MPPDKAQTKDARSVISAVGKQISKWWNKSGPDVLNIPVFAAGVALLNLAGADMAVATAAAAVMAGGERVADVLSAKRSTTATDHRKRMPPS